MYFISGFEGISCKAARGVLANLLMPVPYWDGSILCTTCVLSVFSGGLGRFSSILVNPCTEMGAHLRFRLPGSSLSRLLFRHIHNAGWEGSRDIISLPWNFTRGRFYQAGSLDTKRVYCPLGKD